MKSIKIAGLCLVALAAMAMATAATASATPVWEQLNGTTWSEIKGTEKVIDAGTLKLTDTKGGLTGGVVTVECSGTSTGTVGPGKYDRITTITVANPCRNITGCVGTIKAEARNLPWQTELFETEGKVRDSVVSEVAGKFPGWKVECTLSDTCEGNTTTAIVNNTSNNTVEAVFDAKSAVVTCSRGGAGTGKVEGTNIIKENESPFTGVRVS
jgi:hypothetical protein